MLVRPLVWSALLAASVPGLASAQEPPAPGDTAIAVPRPPGPAGVQLMPDGVGTFGWMRDRYSIVMTGVLQLQLAPYLGDDSLVENEDPATEEGFRVRRARFGVYGRLPADFTYRLAFDVLDDLSASTADARPVGARLRDAFVGWDGSKYASLIMGAGKVPFVRGNFTSSIELAVIEEPLTVKRLGIDRRVGASVSGAVGPVSYGLGVFNADPALSFGNRADGLLTTGRVEFATAAIGYGQSTLGPGSRAPGGFAVGLGGTLRRDGTLEGQSYGGDLAFRHKWVVATAELIASHTEPVTQPATPADPNAQTEVDALGAYGTVAVAVVPGVIEAAARLEYFDPNTDLDDEGDVLVLTGGANAAILEGNIKAGLHYIRRAERNGRKLANDAVVVQLQASF